MVKRILLIKLRHHGDVLLTTPLINALKNHDPEYEIDVLIYQETVDIVRAHPAIAHIHLIDRNWKKLGYAQQLRHEWALVQAVRARHYDVVICLADQWRAALLTKVSGAKTRIGIDYPYRSGRWWRHCFSDLLPELNSSHHMVEQNLLALQPLAIHRPKSVPLTVAYYADDAARVEHVLRQQGWQGEAYVLVHPGSRWFFKCWDDDKTCAIVQKLMDMNLTVVLSAAPDARELDIIRAIQDNVQQRGGRLLNMAAAVNLRELAALIEGADLFFGVDSLPMHMAAAAATPTVALFGPTLLARWRPWSEHATVVYAGDYGELPHPSSIDVHTKQRYLSAIPVAAVWQAIETYLPLGARV